MVSPSPSLPATRHQWNKRFEEYTPSGYLGQILFVIISGSIGLLSLGLSLASLAAPGLFTIPLAVVFAGVGLGASLLMIVMLWSIYLSLIDTGQSTRSHMETGEVSSSDGDDEGSLEVVKRQYAAGNISEEEFERRVENLLHTDTKSRIEPNTMSSHTKDTVEESTESH